MAMRMLALSLCAGLALGAAGCPAPEAQAPASSSPRPQAQQAAASTQARQAAAPTDSQAALPASAADQAPEAPTRDLDKLRKLKVRTGGPLPPRVLPPPGPGQTCRTDADCGSADANQDGAGGASSCGADGDRPCRCVDGTCIALAPALDPPVDPAPQPPEQR